MDKNVYAAIQSQYATFSKVGKRIADHIIADPVHITSISIQQMAAELDIAESSIIRFCKIVGCAGFSEVKLLLAKYFPKTYTPSQKQKIIVKLLEDWHKRQLRQQER